MNPDQAKFLADYFVRMIAGEAQTTAKVLAAVPDVGRDYRPDAKSRSAWELATHMASADVWFLDSIAKGAFVFDPSAEKQQIAAFTTIKDVVDFYNREVPDRLQALGALSPQELAADVDFFGMFTQARAGLLGMANNHSIHHRGQLASYLRAMGSKVPSIYGGSADEPMTAAAN
jgi:uncharacterized damage-inducible protein DinB